MTKYIFNGKYAAFFSAAVLIAGVIVFSCTSGDSGYRLFGEDYSSPLRTGTPDNQAVLMQERFREIFRMYRERVVYITTEQHVTMRPHPFFDDPMMRRFFFDTYRPRVQKRTGLGTGFIISEDGYVCTNHHVISGVDRVTVNVNERNYEAEIIGSDAATDIALLKIITSERFRPVYFGDSESVEVGDWAIAIGNPFGLDKTFTVGVISATGRNDVDMMGGSHLQTDASINPGNSGGPLINVYGEVIGINRMIYSKSGGYMGIGFAIPVNIARSILSQLEKHKKVKRGYIGVNIIPLTDEYAQELGLDSKSGVFVGAVEKNSPAEKSGLMVGDVIRNFNGVVIENGSALMNQINQITPGSKVTVTVVRERRILKLLMTIEERPG